MKVRVMQVAGVPDAEPVDYFSLFCSEGLLNNITKTVNSQDSWFFGPCPSSGTLKNTAFWKLDLVPS
jgi:hypothetical protein